MPILMRAIRPFRSNLGYNLPNQNRDPDGQGAVWPRAGFKPGPRRAANIRAAWPRMSLRG
jgi:hypothetical protein